MTESWTTQRPEGWRVVRFKTLFLDRSGSISVEAMADVEVDHYSIPAYDALSAPAREDGNTIASNKTLLGGGELLYSKLNSHKPRAWIVPTDEAMKVASTEFIAISEWHRGKSCLPYFRYLLGSNAFADYISCFQTSVTNSHKRINPNDLWQTATPIPTLVEQQRISAYLDASSHAIEAAVAAKRKQIAILRLTLESIVISAVTHGLDPSVRMKSTVIDWLSEVPAHWEVQHIKRRCGLLRGKFSHRPRNDPALYDGEHPFIQTGDISSADKYITSYSQTLNDDGLAVSKQFPRGTLVMSIAANIGDVAILDFEACFPDSVVGLVPNHDTDLNFLYYMMLAMKPIMLRAAVLTTQLNLNYVRIGMNYAAFPPLHEQKTIAAFIDTKIAEVTATIDVLVRQIDVLVSYRNSLIHECVTGQRRITEADFDRVQAHA